MATRLFRKQTAWFARLAIAALCLSVMPTDRPLHAAGDKGGKARSKSAPPEQAPPKPTPLPEPDHSRTLDQQYCTAVRDEAVEARFAFQAAHLETLSKQVEAQLVRLETRSAELKEWLAKREALVQQATTQLVGIFGSMRPEAASDQLVRLDGMIAAAILLKLDQRTASAILNDMPPDKAAKLTNIMVAAARKSDQDTKR